MANLTYVAIVDQKYGPFYNVQDAIDDVLASGITDTDQGVVRVFSGAYGPASYFLNSGLLFLRGEEGVLVSGLFPAGSGSLKCDSIGLGLVSGSLGNNEIYNSTILSGSFVSGKEITFSSVTVVSGLSMIENIVTYILDLTSTGPAGLTFSGGAQTTIMSGHITSPISFYSCSGLMMESLLLNYSQNSYPITLTNTSGFIFNHLTTVNDQSGVIKLLNSSGNITYSILVSSGSIPVSGGISLLSGSCIYDITSPQWTGFGVNNIYADPLFVGSGDFRLVTRSFCACVADYINDTEYDPTAVVKSNLSASGIQFFSTVDDYKVVSPSSIYLVRDGMAIYLLSGNYLSDNIKLNINTQYFVSSDIETIQSLSDSRITKHPYPNDYMITSRYSYALKDYDMFVIPYTIVPLDSLLLSKKDKLRDVVISGYFQDSLLERDHLILGNKPIHWILDSANSYLKARTSDTQEEIGIYPLFSQSNISGFPIVTLADMYPINKGLTQSQFQTDKYFDGKTVSTKTLIFASPEPKFKLFSFTRDLAQNPVGILDYRDWLYVLNERTLLNNTDVVIVDEVETKKSSLFVSIYNKFDQYPFESKYEIDLKSPKDIHGVTDICVDDVGDLHILSSGTIARFKQFYDYALVTRNIGTMKTTLTLREEYEGVQI